MVALHEKKTKILLFSCIFKGFLGDPERNVRILNLHLMVAQRKAEPKLAARYLARILFSKDVLVCSSAGVSSRVPNLSGRQPLDPNKMAAIRGM